VCLHHSTKAANIKKVILLSAHRQRVNVLTSNITFLISAVLVLWCSHSRPYQSL